MSSGSPRGIDVENEDDDGRRAEPEAGDYLGCLERADRRERLALVHHWIVDGDLLLYAADPRRIVAYVWTGTEAPPSQDQEEWIDMFSSVVGLFGRVSDTDEELSGELTVFRGHAGDEGLPGMSWTLSREKAEWFARRFPEYGEPVVYAATVQAEDVLGYFTGRGESEVVVDPETLGALRDVRAVEIEQADQTRWPGSHTVRIFPNP
jgi:hypothetical protein